MEPGLSSRHSESRLCAPNPLGLPDLAAVSDAESLAALVSCGCCNEVPQTRWQESMLS